jgi:hypothetical protein
VDARERSRSPIRFEVFVAEADDGVVSAFEQLLLVRIRFPPLLGVVIPVPVELDHQPVIWEEDVDLDPRRRSWRMRVRVEPRKVRVGSEEFDKRVLSARPGRRRSERNLPFDPFAARVAGRALELGGELLDCGLVLHLCLVDQSLEHVVVSDHCREIENGALGSGQPDPADLGYRRRRADPVDDDPGP